MEIEITIHTCLRSYSFKVNAVDYYRSFGAAAAEQHRDQLWIQAWDQDHGDTPLIVVPDYYDDPQGHDESMQKLEQLRAANEDQGEEKKQIKIEIPSSNLIESRITWGGQA